jgi:hypothetical protein
VGAHFTSTHSAGLARPGATIVFGRPPIGWLESGNQPEGDGSDADDLSFAITTVSVLVSSHRFLSIFLL